MSYTVKEIFGPTLQGEGPHAGYPCVFLRLTGCNAWDGRPETRAASACPYCDTNFRGGEVYQLPEIISALKQQTNGHHHCGVVLTGGEPLLQADEALLRALGNSFPWVDIESNGSKACPAKPDNVTLVCSPKAIPGQSLVAKPDAWKILIPDQQSFLAEALASGAPVWLQPTCPDDGPQGDAYHKNLQQCIHLCYTNDCRLSLQQHKYLGLD